MTTMFKEFKTTLEIDRRSYLMSRVRTVRSIRAFMASPLSSACMAILFVTISCVLVSIGDVTHNIMAHGEWSGRLSYVYTSLMHSRIIVQALVFFTIVSCFMVLVRSAFKLRTPLYFVGNFIVSMSPVRFFRS